MNDSTHWTCDSCGEKIVNVEHGWVEWLVRKEGEKRVGGGLRLVHHCSAHDPLSGRCQYKEVEQFSKDRATLLDLPLKNFVGADGLMELLSMLASGEIAKEEVLEMIKRLHVPGYEQARHHFDEAISNGVFEPNTAPGYYSTKDIAKTLEFISSISGAPPIV